MQTLSDTVAGWRVAATAVVQEVEQGVRVVKKLKLTGRGGGGWGEVGRGWGFGVGRERRGRRVGAVGWGCKAPGAMEWLSCRSVEVALVKWGAKQG